MKKISILLILLLCSFYASTKGSSQKDYDKITISTEKKLDSLYVITEFYVLNDIDTVWAYFSDPLRLYDVFNDYENIEVIADNGNSLDIAYEVKLPVVSNMNFTVRQDLIPRDHISWYLLEGDLKKNEGTYDFQPFTAGVKIRFVSLFELKSDILNKVGNFVVKMKTKSSVQKIKKYLEAL